ncbi:J domain-containing protein [Desulfoplanes formicivorans]|uniref:Molecular chaperone DnaJ n=1 Tax=Desulfoplanes formicivorans TaxID=1592317 RepID=A0A194AG94_9BACT|nr:DnaJ domain-containing protein [Desulfoplanes formicivorans]GAU08106.1 molecular chaperone DnaJ [Desulfoplanes formicivorans]
MDLRQAYRIIGLRFGADLDTVKSAFRKQAFAYHPDLHPDDPQAAKKFHDLNKAYVHLKEYLTAKEQKKAARKQARSEDQTPPTGSTSFASAHASNGHKADTFASDNRQRPKKGFAARQEETLKDILNDPFARQVFEDIFERIKTRKPSISTRAQTTAGTPQKKLSLSWGKRSLDLDVTHGLWTGVKKWFGSQLDDWQTIHLPAPQLRPGSKVRVQIQRKGKGSMSLELRLPHNFIVGRPIRLKGQGRSLGPFKGDLYLRFLAV